MFGGPQGAQDVRVSGGILANDGSAVHMAARAGYGIAFLPLVQVIDGQCNGELVRVLSDYPPPGLPISLVYSSRRHLAPRTRVVMAFILEKCARCALRSPRSPKRRSCDRLTGSSRESIVAYRALAVEAFGRSARIERQRLARLLIGSGSRRRSASQAIDILGFVGSSWTPNHTPDRIAAR
jgi:hypothetical protein